MANTQVELQVPQLSQFSGELNNVVRYIGQNIQVITESINVIRRDQELIFYKLVPELIKKQDDITRNQEVLLTKIDAIDDKLNDVLNMITSNEISKSHDEQLPNGGLFGTWESPKRAIINAKYCIEEIPDEELTSLDQEQLKRLRMNIASTKYKYKKAGKSDHVDMCELNTNKITSLLMKRNIVDKIMTSRA